MKKSLKLILQKTGIYFPALISWHSFLNKTKSYYYRIKLYPEKGSGYTCNYCGAVYKNFIEWAPPEKYRHALTVNNVIAGYGKNCICPVCLSTSRERLVKIAIEHFFTGNDNTILHLAPEKKIYQLLQKKGDVTTADPLAGLYSHIDPSIKNADATKLPFKNHEFNWVIANHIMEHIPDDLAAMKEIYRVLKTGGKALLQVPYSHTLQNTIETPDINNPSEQAAQFGQEDHVRIYSLRDYTDRLNKAGFSVKIFNDDWQKPYNLHALQPGENIILASK